MSIAKTILKTLIVLLILTPLMQSCEKDVILDLADMDGQYLMVEANITDNGDLQWIRLTRSSSYYRVSTGDPVEGATVIVNDGSKEYIFEPLLQGIKGYYFNDIISAELSEKDYQLNITTPDGESYFAQSTFRPVPVLDSITIKPNPFSDLGIFPETIYDIFVHFEELPDPGDHYLFNMFINDELKTTRPTDKAPVSDENLEPYVSYAVLDIPEKDLFPGDTLMVEIRSISKEQFDFYNVFFFQTDLSGNPFAGAPPANIPTNLSEGAKGFFQVSATHRQSTIYQPQPQ